ncbi:cell division protein FtsA, partial [Candidatus Saccharibacteria bacterium]|nr:cell division protein FtsA [Candidatus Saccharibacteria bacterium]
MASKQETTFVGLDVSTSKVCCVVGVAQEDSPNVSIIGMGVAQTNGLRRGIVIDIEETVSAITAALEEAERMSGTVIERVTASVDGSHIQSMNSRGVIAVSRADKQISREDMERAEDAAAALSLDANREILKVIPRNYIVDGQTNIADPYGMSGVRLEIDTHIITASVPAMKNLDDAIHRAGITVANHVIAPMATAKAVLTKRQKELGVALVDIGSETTGIAVYEDGKVSFTSILPIGSNHITKDIMHALRTTIDVAEKIKCNFGRAQEPDDQSKATIALDKIGLKGSLLQCELDMVVSARIDEMCKLIRQELEKAGEDHLLASGVVLSGGGSKLKKLPAYMESHIKLPISLAQPTA